MLKPETIDELKTFISEQEFELITTDEGIGLYEYQGTKYNDIDIHIEIIYDFILIDITELVGDKNYHFDLDEINKFYIPILKFYDGKDYEIELEVNLEGVINEDGKIIGRYSWGV